MRVIRAYDGRLLPIAIDDFPPDPSLETVLTMVAECSDIPVTALIVMHPSGRQMDRDSLRILMGRPAGSKQDTAEQATVFAFDRELIEADLAGPEGIEVMRQMDKNTVQMVADAPANDQLALTVDLIQSIREQRNALSAALNNLERHRGGRQEAIKAYTHFAAPQLKQFKDVLAVYPAAISIASQINVIPKLQGSSSSSSSSDAKSARVSRDRPLSDYVNQERMENVRKSCQRVLDDLEAKDAEMQSLVQGIAAETASLKQGFSEYNSDDLDVAETDAREAYTKLLHMVEQAEPSQAHPDRNPAVRELFEEVEDRLEYLVKRKHIDTRRLLVSLQSIAQLQSQIAQTPKMTQAFNDDLRTKCDGFKHLTRIRNFASSYVATLAEAIRRRLYLNNILACSAAQAATFDKLGAEEKKRRGIFQAEWAGTLPWAIPGFEQPVASLDIHLTGTRDSATDNDEDTNGNLSVADLDNLIEALTNVSTSLKPEDYPAGEVPHPVDDALSLAIKYKKQIEDLQHEFNALRARITSPEASVSSADSASKPSAELRDAVTKDKYTQLQAELADARGSIDQQAAEHDARVAALREEVAHAVAKQTSAEEAVLLSENTIESLKRTAAAARQAEQDSNAEAKRLRQDLIAEQAQSTRKMADQAALVKILELELTELKSRHAVIARELTNSEERCEVLQERSRDLLNNLRQKEQTIKDMTTERAAIAAERAADLVAQRERSVQHEQAISAASNDKAALHELQISLSTKESEAAELQVMCNERSKALSQALSQATTISSDTRTLLNHLRLFFDSHIVPLTHFVNEPTLVAKSAAPKEMPVIVSPVPMFDAASMSAAIESLATMDCSVFEHTKQKIQASSLQTRKWQKECKRYKERTERAVAASRDKIAFGSFAVGDVALFLPTRNAATQLFAAFNYGKPNYFLTPTGILVDHVKTRDYIIARISSIKEATVTLDDPVGNPYSLALGSRYFQLEAEPWRREKDREKLVSMSKEAAATRAGARRASASEAVPQSQEPCNGVPERSDTLTASNLPGHSPDSASPQRVQEAFPPDIIPQTVEGPSSPPPFVRRTVSESPATAFSALSAQRPAVLDVIVEPEPHLESTILRGTSGAAVSSPPDLVAATSLPDLQPSSVGSVAAAFLPMASRDSHRHSVNLSATRPPMGTSMPRSASSNESHGPSSWKMMAGSQLMGSMTTKARPVCATTEALSDDGSSWMDLRRTHTVGRYVSRSTGARLGSTPDGASRMPARSASNAADILRSFSTNSKNIPNTSEH